MNDAPHTHLHPRSAALPLQDGDLLAAIDLGSNSFHMVVSRYVLGQLRTVDRLREMVRLADVLTAVGTAEEPLAALVERVAAEAGLAPEDVARREERVPGFVQRLAQALVAGTPEAVKTRVLG